MSSNEMERSLSHEVEHSDDYSSSPGLFTAAGAADRKDEARHCSAIRHLRRELRERMARSAVEAGADIAEIEARAKVLTEAKYLLARAADESEVIAKGDPEKVAKLAILDDDAFHEIRVLLHRPRPDAGGLFS